MTNTTTAVEGVHPLKGQRNPAFALISPNTLAACRKARRPYVPGRCEVRPQWLIEAIDRALTAHHIPMLMERLK